MNAVKSNTRSGCGNPALLQACIRETVRYYAKRKYLHLATQRDRASGTEVTVPTSLHFRQHASLTSPQADSWLPGRWINAENNLVDSENDPYDGVRCPGERLKMAITIHVLETLLRSYDISWASPSQPQTVDFEALDFDQIGLPWLKVRREPTPKRSGLELTKAQGGLRVKFSRRVYPELVGGC